ncbi:hypothetical protein [Alteromonas gilva]|uniref:Uncharacterized protein n=1 Tax=Alteromonas gilva TaxID=2987522 RepID=A0ABT5L2Z2_9ALTE|nr:hypothetical protein [Alteromonas gilva]MDC8830212.1 hypothetical protein [Alteromonas gilva]
MQPDNQTVLNEEQLTAVTGAGVSFMHNPDVISTNWPEPADSPFYVPCSEPVLFSN